MVRDVGAFWGISERCATEHKQEEAAVFTVCLGVLCLIRQPSGAAGRPRWLHRFWHCGPRQPCHMGRRGGAAALYSGMHPSPLALSLQARMLHALPGVSIQSCPADDCSACADTRFHHDGARARDSGRYQHRCGHPGAPEYQRACWTLSRGVHVNMQKHRRSCWDPAVTGNP